MQVKPLDELEIVLVLRECHACGVRKPLEHFLLHKWTGNHNVAKDVHICAACRGKGRKEKVA